MQRYGTVLLLHTVRTWRCTCDVFFMFVAFASQFFELITYNGCFISINKVRVTLSLIKTTQNVIMSALMWLPAVHMIFGNTLFFNTS